MHEASFYRAARAGAGCACGDRPCSKPDRTCALSGRPGGTDGYTRNINHWGGTDAVAPPALKGPKRRDRRVTAGPRQDVASLPVGPEAAAAAAATSYTEVGRGVCLDSAHRVPPWQQFVVSSPMGHAGCEPFCNGQEACTGYSGYDVGV